ncbi:hypothetical protein AURDEDRAFT_24311, partial [Auricularia subglabra TFB-10046 SS5]
LTLVLAATSAIAAPLRTPHEPRSVWDPRVMTPHTGTVWKRGATHAVKWDASHPPKDGVSNGSAIYLRKGDMTLMEHPLAEGFDLHKGHQNVKIPGDIAPGEDYRIVLFGDSGNWSEQFTIV